MGAVPLGGGLPMALAAVATIRIRHVPMVAPRRGYIRVARRRKGASFFIHARQERGPGAKRTSFRRQRSSGKSAISRHTRLNGNSYHEEFVAIGNTRYIGATRRRGRLHPLISKETS